MRIGVDEIFIIYSIVLCKNMILRDLTSLHEFCYTRENVLRYYAGFSQIGSHLTLEGAIELEGI